jgi:nicotinamidase-related amidase
MTSAFGMSIPQTLEEVCDPQRIALLIYDMQVGILSQIKNPDDITRQVLKVLTAAREARVRVFFSRPSRYQKNSWAFFSSAWPWLGNGRIRLSK